MRAILVSVDYADLLALTLPYNFHHFSEVWVVTAPGDAKTAEVAAACGARVFVTSAFFARGARFNKWAALEEGLDAMGRHGWLTIMDADVLWPKSLGGWQPTAGQLAGPFRRMAPLPPAGTGQLDLDQMWRNLDAYPRHRNVNEHAGYSIIFHADDPAASQRPWFDTCYTHAGISDSLFQQRWPAEKKVRPPWEVIHLGEAGANWLGRASPYADGTVPAGAAEKREELRRLIRGRTAGPDRFKGEKL